MQKRCQALGHEDCAYYPHDTYLHPEGTQKLHLCSHSAKLYKLDGWKTVKTVDEEDSADMEAIISEERHGSEE